MSPLLAIRAASEVVCPAIHATYETTYPAIRAAREVVVATAIRVTHLPRGCCSHPPRGGGGASGTRGAGPTVLTPWELVASVIAHFGR